MQHSLKRASQCSLVQAFSTWWSSLVPPFKHGRGQECGLLLIMWSSCAEGRRTGPRELTEHQDLSRTARRRCDDVCRSI